MNQVPGLVDGVFRRSAGRLVAMLTTRLGPARLDLAEEAVQDALLKALQTWPHRGVPDNPEAWLMQVARNRALDLLRKDTRHDAAAATLDAAAATSTEAVAGEADELALLLLCCHPALTPRARVALALKTVGGFSVGEIARAFLSEPEAVAQLLVRARRTIRDQGLGLEAKGDAVPSGRLIAALDTLYLMFNEGYSATEGERAIREELCVAAIRLTEMFLADPATAQPEVRALLALMLFQASRLEARTGPAGELHLLDDQDRSQWSRPMIAAGFRQLGQASTGAHVTPWHIEAAIASVHAAAERPEDTDWSRVLTLYDDLMSLKPSPVVRLNRAVALGRLGRVDAALRELDEVATHPAMRRYFLLDAARADLLLRAGRTGEARAALTQAASRAGTEPERRLLLARLARATEEPLMHNRTRAPTGLVLLLAIAAALIGASRAGSATHAPPAAQASDSLFALTFAVGPGWESTKPPGAQAGFREHSQNLARLRREGRILAGGRFGALGLMLVRARDSAEVRGQLAGDSTLTRGVFTATIDVWRTIYDGPVPAR
jgi:RNA polymerase sigma-70 factor (ECF subfamily)